MRPAATLLVLVMVMTPSVAFAADPPLPFSSEPPSSLIVNTIPTLASVDLTARTGHIAAAMQTATTKLKRPDAVVVVVVIVVVIAVVAAILFIQNNAGLEGDIH